MLDKNADNALDDVLTNDAASKRLIKEDGSIDIPGTPIILSNNATEPKEGEYVDNSIEGAITNDSNKIEALKAKNGIEVIENRLVGSFNKCGVYEVSPEVEKELIDMVKIIDSVEQAENESEINVDGETVKVIPGVIYCSSAASFSGAGNFNFAIQTYYDSTNAYSELFLLEDVKKADGFIKSVNIYSTGKFKAVYSSTYQAEMFRYFNVVSKETALKMSEEEKLLFGWAYRRKLYFKNLLELGNAKYLLAEATYFSAKIEALSGLGAFGTNVLATFNELKIQAAKILGKELNSRDLNDLLDMCIDQISEKYPELTKQYYSTIVDDTRIYQGDIKNTTEQNTELAKNKVKAISKSSPIYDYKYNKANQAYKPEVKAQKSVPYPGKIKNKEQLNKTINNPQKIEKKVDKKSIKQIYNVGVEIKQNNEYYQPPTKKDLGNSILLRINNEFVENDNVQVKETERTN